MALPSRISLIDGSLNNGFNKESESFSLLFPFTDRSQSFVAKKILKYSMIIDAIFLCDLRPACIPSGANRSILALNFRLPELVSGQTKSFILTDGIP